MPGRGLLMIDIALAVMLYFTFMMICVINEHDKG
nr:MAG TPA: hypothetical protein [Caudoviricetes sp.]